MTLKELKQRVDFYYEMGEHYHSLNVCIPNNKPGFMGGIAVTNVSQVNRGIDWDNGKLFIFPEKPMIEK